MSNTTSARKRMRAPQLIGADKNTLQIMLDELYKVAGYTKHYNHSIVEGKAPETETPYEFVLNRIDDINYSLTKLKSNREDEAA